MPLKRLNTAVAAFCIAILALTACSRNSGDTIRVYTSMYPESIQLYKSALSAKYPELNIEWYQNGSENIAAKIATEEMAGNVQADLLLTADIFWFKKMADQGFFLPHAAVLDYDIADEFEDKLNRFTTPRVSVMVIGYNKKSLGDGDAPKSWSDLADPKWKGKITSGSPLESGSNYSLMMNLAYKYGYDYLKKLRANDLMSAGGNSAVMQRIATGERPVGMILLENVLIEGKRNPNIGFVYPSDGAIVLPGPMGITKASKNPEAAKKTYDFFLSHEGQKIALGGMIHSVDPAAGAPEGAKTLDELRANAFEISDKFYEFAKSEQEDFKAKYSDIMFQ